MSKFENSELYMSREDFKNVIAGYSKKPAFIGLDGEDLEEIFYFVEDILREEKTALEREEPYATRAIDRYAAAAYEVSCLARQIADAYEEVYGN